MILLFHGKNSYLSFKEAKSLLERVSDKRVKQNKSIENISIDASSSPFEQIVNEIETPSFFNNHKIVFLKRPSGNNEKEKINDWILDMVVNKNQRKGIDIIIWEDKKVRSNSKLIKEMGKSAWVSPELTPRSFTKWAKDEVKKIDINIENNALDLLSQRVNYEPERFHQEIEKIKLLGKRKISDKEIENICPDTLEKSVWDFVDSLNSSNKGQSSELLNDLLQQGNDPYFLLSMISRNIRILLLTKLLDEKGLDSSEISKEIGTHPFVISKIKSKAKNTDIKRIRKIYEKLASIDYTTKTGQIDIELALNLLISVI